MLDVVELKKACTGGAIKTEGKSSISFNDIRDSIVATVRDIRIKNSIDMDDYEPIVKATIEDFITTKQPLVTGYVDENDNILAEGLKKDLEDAILGWGKLTCCRDDESIREIQINGPAIFIDKGNKYQLLRDSNGVPVTFDSPDECFNFITNALLFSGERLQVDECLVNGRTVEGYRIAATHPIINPPSEETPTIKWPTALIRKIGHKFSEEDYINYKTATQEMLDFFKAVGMAKLGFVVLGTTGCGKTTTMNFVVRNLPDNVRVGVIQKPTEIMYERRVDGYVVNNMFYWEASDKADPNSKGSSTVDNLVDHSLRYTADYLLLGEIRSSNEFASAARASNTGTDWMSTYHSFSVVAGLDRFALELQIALHIDFESAKVLAARYMCIAVFQDRLGDGSRRLMEVAEVIGYDIEKREYIINYLYKFVPTAVKYSKDGEAGVEGKFVKLNNISNELKQKMLNRAVGDRYTKSFCYDFEKDENGECVIEEILYPDYE